MADLDRAVIQLQASDWIVGRILQKPPPKGRGIQHQTSGRRLNLLLTRGERDSAIRDPRTVPQEISCRLPPPDAIPASTLRARGRTPCPHLRTHPPSPLDVLRIT